MRDQVDFLASEVHFFDHLAPIWYAMPNRRRGHFFVPGPLAAHAHAAMITPSIYGRSDRDQTHEHRLTVVSSSADYLQAVNAGCRVVLAEHGAGQSYRRQHSSYAGWPRRRGVVLFLSGSIHAAHLNKQAHPDVPVVAQGPQRLDAWHRGEIAVPENESPVIAVSFHWNCHVVPETMGAFEHFMQGVIVLSKEYYVIGHGHPRAWRKLEPFYRKHGIEPVRSFDEVLRRADVYCVDNSSTLFEFAAAAPSNMSRPVVVLNPPHYRRDVHHGLRFWECASIGVNCDNSRDLPYAVRLAMEDLPEQQQLRTEALEKVYPVRDGRAAKRAAKAILAILCEKPVSMEVSYGR